MTKDASWLFPDGPQNPALQVERGSMWIWVPNNHLYSNHKLSCFIILLYLYLNNFTSLDPTKLINELVGCCTNTVKKQLRTMRCYPCLPAAGEAQKEGNETELDTNWLYNCYTILQNHFFKETWNTLSTKKQSPFPTFQVVSITISISLLAMIPSTV